MGWISDKLVILVLVVGSIALFFPEPALQLSWITIPVLAAMVFCVSMTISLEDILRIRRYPWIIVTSLALQFVVMVFFSFLLGRIFFSSQQNLNVGQILLGALPADISAPLMVTLVGGDTALGMAMLVSAMLLTPFILPLILTTFGGISIQVPIGYLEAELFGIIIFPMIAGILINCYLGCNPQRKDIFQGSAACCYLLLLFVVVSSNAMSILSLKELAFIILSAEVLLNFFGYCCVYVIYVIFRNARDAILPLFFIVGTKEFGIAPATTEAMGLSSSIVIPSVFYAIVQMISSPLLVKILNYYKKNAFR